MSCYKCLMYDHISISPSTQKMYVLTVEKSKMTLMTAVNHRRLAVFTAKIVTISGLTNIVVRNPFAT